ncbi:MAG: AAA family ATPase [Syntrophobacteraceae bacterium]|nr:AAA family ATPase [Syntrophobacteraceae bacterium]
MKCHSCGRQISLNANFCGHCGCAIRSSIGCPFCDRLNPPDVQFCINCGASLAGGRPPRFPQPDSSAVQPKVMPAESERRHITVMFCDLVDSSSIAEQQDPEDYHEMVRSYQETCSRVVSKYEGHIAQHFGDGVLVYFGYPQAHEDDAQRAVRAGLRILDDLVYLSTSLEERYGVRLSARIGIHSGSVVVGETGGDDPGEKLAFGHTMNVAARLQGIAETNSVVMSDATFRLVKGLFIVQDLGRQSLKGIGDRINAYKVLQASGVENKFELVGTHRRTPLIGRREEVGVLLECWKQAREGRGQVVLVSGEAGIGKTRLALVLREQLDQHPHTWMECRGSPFHQDSALHPVIDLLRRGLFFTSEDSPGDKIAKLELGLSRMGFSLNEAIPLLTSLLLLPLPAHYPPLPLSPEAQRGKTLELLSSWLFGLAKLQPLVLVVDDLHWIDPSSLQLLSLLIEGVWSLPALLVFAFRPSFRSRWDHERRITRIPLSPLADHQVRSMISGVAGGKPMPRDVVDHLVEKTDGIPIYVEELTKMVLESGVLRERDQDRAFTEPIPSLAIPTTLQDSLMARLDRLSQVKGVAQLGAALGREFPYGLLQVLSPLREAFLQEALCQLVEADILHQRGTLPRATYIFKHALLQEAAYGTMLKSKRREVHRKIVLALQETSPEVVADEPEILAHHCEAAGLMKEAVGYWYRAGQKALTSSASVEAVSHLTKGLRSLKDLPAGPQRSQLELSLQMALGLGLIATHGYSSEQVLNTFGRAHELCGELAESAQLFSVVFGLFMFHAVRSDRKETRETTSQLLRLAKRSGDPNLLVEAHAAMSVAELLQGAHVSASEHISQCLSVYDPARHRSHVFVYGHDPGAVVHAYSGLNLWFLGYPDQALSSIEKALSLARESSHPFTLAHVLSTSAELRHLRREFKEVSELAGQNVALSIEQKFPLWIGAGYCEQGWVLSCEGHVRDGIKKMKEGMALVRGTGSRARRPYHQLNLTELYLRAGMVREGLAEVDEALSASYDSLSHHYLAELHRLRGELLLRSSGEKRAEAESCFRQALDVARDQRARSLELRAAMSLGRLFAADGRKDEAREGLAGIFGTFTEGFETADLREAKALLEELS